MGGEIFPKFWRDSRLIVKILTEHASQNRSTIVNFLTEHWSIGSVFVNYLTGFHAPAVFVDFSDFIFISNINTQ